MNKLLMSVILSAVQAVDYAKAASALKISSVVLFALAAVCLVLAIASFIVFKIPMVIGDLSGRNARRSIAQMREQNEHSGTKTHRPHPIAMERGTVTQPIQQHRSGSKRLRKKTKMQPQDKLKTTASPVSDENVPTDVLHSDETQLLEGEVLPTEVLSQMNETETLNYDAGGTQVLNEGTQVLSSAEITEALEQKSISIKMIQDIVLIHTDEVI